MGFTSIELLFKRRPRGLLHIAKKALEEQPSLFLTRINYLREMQEHMDKMTPIMCQHLLSNQAE